MARFHVGAARPLLLALGRWSLFIQVFVTFLLLTGSASAQFTGNIPVSYTHLTLPTTYACRSRWSPYH